MARFYQTASPQYLDYVYQPPWELINQVMATKQNEYDTALTATSALNNLLQIQHINSEEENDNVRNIQQRWEASVNDLSNQIRQDPGNTASYLPQIQQLQREIMADRQSGNISKIENSYNSLQQWMKDNEQIKKDNPGRYSAGYNYFMNKWMESGGNSLRQGWRGDLVSKDLEWDKIIKSVNDLKSSSIKGTQATPTGTGYIVERGGKTEVLTEGELNNYLLSQVLDPTSINSLRQSQQFGLGQYFTDGVLDPNAPGFSNLRLASSATAYENREDNTKYSTDSRWTTVYSQEQANKRHAAGIRATRENIYIKAQLDEQAAANKANRDQMDALNAIVDNFGGEYSEDDVLKAQRKIAQLQGIPFMEYVQGKAMGTLDDVLQSGDKDLALEAWKNVSQRDKDNYSQSFMQYINGDISKDDFRAQVVKDKFLSKDNDYSVRKAIRQEFIDYYMQNPRFVRTSSPGSPKVSREDIIKEAEEAYYRFTNLLNTDPKKAIQEIDDFDPIGVIGNSKTIKGLVKGFDNTMGSIDKEIKKFDIKHPVQSQYLSAPVQTYTSDLISNNQQSFYFRGKDGKIYEPGDFENFSVDRVAAVGEYGISLIGRIGDKEVVATPIGENTPVNANLLNLISQDIPSTSALYPSIISSDVRKIDKEVNRLISQSNELYSSSSLLNDRNLTGKTNYSIKPITDPVTGSTSFKVYTPGSMGSPYDEIGEFSSSTTLVEWLNANKK